MNKLPSQFQINDIVSLSLEDTDKLSPCIVKSVRFTESKVLYTLQYGIHSLNDMDSNYVNQDLN